VQEEERGAFSDPWHCEHFVHALLRLDHTIHILIKISCILLLSSLSFREQGLYFGRVNADPLVKPVAPALISPFFVALGAIFHINTIANQRERHCSVSRDLLVLKIEDARFVPDCFVVHIAQRAHFQVRFPVKKVLGLGLVLRNLD
jgi:hypothetical protein